MYCLKVTLQKYRHPGVFTSTYSEQYQFLFYSDVEWEKEFISYSYLLRGANKSWSEWSIDPKVTFTSLPPGKYILMMKAKNHAGKESQPYEVRISIGYPWYRTPLAYLFYFSGFVILIFSY